MATATTHPLGMRSIVRLRKGDEMEIEIDTQPSQADRQQSRLGGYQYRYFLGQGRMIFADEDLHQALTDLAPRRGERVHIALTPQGWRAWRGQAAPVAAAPRQAAMPARAAGDSAPAQGSASMLAAHRAAIDVAVEAMRYAESRGLRIAYDAGDIRAIAATLYIQIREGA